MRYVLFACDYDGTLADESAVAPDTIQALERLASSGRRLVLATGRTLGDLLAAFPGIDRFDRVVAENGAIIYDPATRQRRCLAERAPAMVIERLQRAGVSPLGVGEVIIAAKVPHEVTVLETIRELGLGHQVIFNKGAVMILPPGVDKGTGLSAALEELAVSPHEVVAVGDGENDHALLRAVEVGVAVANAVESLKERADSVTDADSSAGVRELIDRIIGSDPTLFAAARSRHQVLLGRTADEQDWWVTRDSGGILVVGPSGSGKSKTTAALHERIVAQGYQVCLIDPEGDYEWTGDTVVTGAADSAPNLDEVMQLLSHPSAQAVVSLLGVQLADRPQFFAGLLSRLQELRARTGRPHWIMIDEAHHVLPAAWDAAPMNVPQSLAPFIAVTVTPREVSLALLSLVDLVIVVGSRPEETLRDVAQRIGVPEPLWSAPDWGGKNGRVVVWSPRGASSPQVVEVPPATQVHRRHTRKYAQGELTIDRSFYFHGPKGELNLRAQNLQIFLQLANGIDDQTWLFHLRAGDYSRWVRDGIKDDKVADRIEQIEQDHSLSAQASRKLVSDAISEHYTLPAGS